MRLYHYTTGNGIFGIINSSELHCSHQRFLNDPTEHSYFDNVLHSVLDRNSFLQTIYVELFITDYKIDSSNQQFIFSLSKNPDSLSMWNYYANGNGYNIAFNIDAIIEKNNSEYRMEKVVMIYDFSLQQSMIKSFVEENTEKFNRFNSLTKQMTQTEDPELVDKLMKEQNDIKEQFTQGIKKLKTSFKHEAYKDEEEVRILIKNEKKGDFKVSGQGVFIEYLKLEMSPDNDIIEIIVHPLSSDLHVEGMKRFINAKIPSKKVNITKSDIPFRLI